MRIHWSIWIVVGAILSGYSRFVDQTGELSFQIFFYVGVAFIFWGVVRLIFSPKSAKPKKEQGKKGRICPRCQTPLFHNSRFCHMCGFKVKYI